MGDAREALARLVAFPTVAGESNEALIAWVAERLEAAGAHVRVLDAWRPDARGLHAVFGPAEERGVLLSAHTDVVAVEGQAWSRDPFALHERDGRLYGRGATDMKAFIAAILAAEIPVGALRRPLHVALSCDEELGCKGAPALLEALAGRIAPPAWCVVGEPTRMRVVERHKGKLAFRAHVRGCAAHSSRPADGVNAVEYAARLIVELQELHAELRAAASDDAFAAPSTTLSTGPIAGGVSLNIVPEACRFDFEVRVLPGQDHGAVTARVEALAGALGERMPPGAGIELVATANYPALAAEPGGDAAAQVAALAGEAAGGAVDFGTEAGLYRAALGVPVVVCGPGDMAQAHVADEYIDHDQLLRGERFVGAIARSLTRAEC
jgi:acetylornithine deacetylase